MFKRIIPVKESVNEKFDLSINNFWSIIITYILIKYEHLNM